VTAVRQRMAMAVRTSPDRVVDVNAAAGGAVVAAPAVVARAGPPARADRTRDAARGRATSRWRL